MKKIRYNEIVVIMIDLIRLKCLGYVARKENWEISAQFHLENLKGGYNLGYQCLGGGMILKCILKECCVRVRVKFK
jgi:hypothetical protein